MSQHSYNHVSVNSVASQELQLLTSDNDLSGELPQNDKSAAFFLPQDILTDIPQEHNVSIAFVVYNSPALFPVRNASQNTTVSNTVVGSQVVSVQVGGIADGTRLTKPVAFLLRLTNTPSSGTNEFVASRRCAFWDFSAASKSTICTVSNYND